MAKPGSQRVAEYHQRKKAGVKILHCLCDRTIIGSLSKKRQLCKSCYDATPDKRHKIWLATNKRRDRSVLQECLSMYGNFKVGSKVTSVDGSVGEVTAITLYIDSSVDAIVVFEDGDEDVFLLSGNLITDCTDKEDFTDRKISGIIQSS